MQVTCCPFLRVLAQMGGSREDVTLREQSHLTKQDIKKQARAAPTAEAASELQLTCSDSVCPQSADFSFFSPPFFSLLLSVAAAATAALVCVSWHGNSNFDFKQTFLRAAFGLCMCNLQLRSAVTCRHACAGFFFFFFYSAAE